MTAALAIALLARQATAPSFPKGTSPDFAKAVLAVESRLVEGDIPGAQEAAKALPVREPRIVWEDATMPKALQAVRAEGLAAVLLRWNRMAKTFKPNVVETGPADLKIAFVPVLPNGASGIPAATRIDAQTPFHATIGLSRGKPGVPIRPEEMNMEVAYALGRYLGVPEAPLPGSSMYRDARPGLATFMPRAEEASIAAANLNLADQMRAAIAAGKPLGIVPPVAHLVSERLELGSIEQGKRLPGEIDVENLGAGTLDYSVIRDCECFQPIPAGSVPSQGRRKVAFSIMTDQYVGHYDKLLLFQSNDPSRPTIELPVSFFVRPAYRLIRPGGDRVVVNSGGGTYDYFFFTPPGSPIHVSTRPHWDGMPAEISYEPWTGLLADPDLGEGPTMRTGWRFHIRLPAKVAPGRGTGTLTVFTDSKMFSVATATLSIQKGIVADDASLGDLTPGSKGVLTVDRPNAPFKITKVDAGILKATVADRRGGWEYQINLEYPGNAPKGDFVAKIKIYTNDPKQPVIETTARGFVL